MPNLSKETKQQIALNYALEKSKDEQEQLVSLMGDFIEAYRSTILVINGTNEADFRTLLSRINKVPPLITNYFRESINIGSFALPIHIETVKVNVNSKNDVFFYFSNDDDLIEVSDRFVSKRYFNYHLFEKSDLDDLLENESFNEFYKTVVDANDSFQKNIQTYYDNLYELIKNIRTLERIEKQFKDVILYLPDNIKVNEDKEDIKDKFAEL
jgi:CRISPR/Cas system-associated protein endoribonuclease Cas2